VMDRALVSYRHGDLVDMCTNLYIVKSLLL